MNRRLLPLFLMLLAGLVTMIISFIRHYSFVGMLTSVLIVFVVFYCFGSIIVYYLDRFETENAKVLVQEDESVIEKDVDADAEEDGTVAAKATNPS